MMPHMKAVREKVVDAITRIDEQIEKYNQAHKQFVDLLTIERNKATELLKEIDKKRDRRFPQGSCKNG